MTTRYVYLDTETTGLSPSHGHRITEIACIEVVDGVRGRDFHTYLNPQRELDPEAAKITGLSLDRLKDEPLFSSVVADFLSFIKGATLVIHNAPFDLRFLNSELQRCKVRGLTNEVIDTLQLAASYYPPGARSLDFLCREYGLENKRVDGLHGAQQDVDMLIEVHKNLIKLPAEKPQKEKPQIEKPEIEKPQTATEKPQTALSKLQRARELSCSVSDLYTSLLRENGRLQVQISRLENKISSLQGKLDAIVRILT